MNLPPDKARLLRQYDNEKKWELICDQVGVDHLCGLAVMFNGLLSALVQDSPGSINQSATFLEF